MLSEYHMVNRERKSISKGYLLLCGVKKDCSGYDYQSLSYEQRGFNKRGEQSTLQPLKITEKNRIGLNIVEYYSKKFLDKCKNNIICLISNDYNRVFRITVQR